MRINYYTGWILNCTEYLIIICKQNNPSHGEVKTVHTIVLTAPNDITVNNNRDLNMKFYYG